MARGGLRRRSADRLRADRDRHRSGRRAGLPEGRRAAPPPMSPWALPGSGSQQRLHGHGRRGPVRPFPGRHAAPTPASTPARCASPPTPAPRWPSSRCAADGEREFLFYRHPSADMLFTPGRGRHRRHRRGQAAALRFDQPRQPRTRAPRALFAADQARAAGTGHLRRQPAPAAVARRRRRQGRRSATGSPRRQVVKLSDDELEFLTGSREPAAVRRASGTTACSWSTLSRGSAGSTWFTATGQQDVPSIKVARRRHHRRRRRLHGRPDRRVSWPTPTPSPTARAGSTAIVPLRQCRRRADHDRARRDSRIAHRAAVESFLEKADHDRTDHSRRRLRSRRVRRHRRSRSCASSCRRSTGATTTSRCPRAAASSASRAAS